VWETEPGGSEFRLSFDGVTSGDKLLLCLAVFDQDVVRDDEIGFGHVDVTALGYQVEGVPGQQVRCLKPMFIPTLWRDQHMDVSRCCVGLMFPV
jgi:hypothetical protein